MTRVTVRDPHTGESCWSATRPGEAGWVDAALRAYRRLTGQTRMHVGLCERLGDGCFRVQFGRRYPGQDAVSLDSIVIVNAEEEAVQ